MAFSYLPQNDDELELKVGDIIEVVGEVRVPGGGGGVWWPRVGCQNSPMAGWPCCGGCWDLGDLTESLLRGKPSREACHPAPSIRADVGPFKTLVSDTDLSWPRRGR